MFFPTITNTLGWFSYTWGLLSIKMKIPQSGTFYRVLQKTVRAEERNGSMVLASPVIVVCTSHSQQSTSFYEMNNNVGNKRNAHVVVHENGKIASETFRNAELIPWETQMTCASLLLQLLLLFSTHSNFQSVSKPKPQLHHQPTHQVLPPRLTSHISTSYLGTVAQATGTESHHIPQGSNPRFLVALIFEQSDTFSCTLH